MPSACSHFIQIQNGPFRPPCGSYRRLISCSFSKFPAYISISLSAFQSIEENKFAYLSWIIELLKRMSEVIQFTSFIVSTYKGRCRSDLSVGQLSALFKIGWSTSPNLQNRLTERARPGSQYRIYRMKSWLEPWKQISKCSFLVKKVILDCITFCINSIKKKVPPRERDGSFGVKLSIQCHAFEMSCSSTLGMMIQDWKLAVFPLAAWIPS